MMEVKWLAIAFAVMFSFMFVSSGFSDYSKSQCRIASVQAGKSVEEIVKICK